MITLSLLPKNSRYVSERLIVGAKQGLRGLRQLRDSDKVTFVLDLRRKQDSLLERFFCKFLGLKYKNIPIKSTRGRTSLKELFLSAAKAIQENTTGKTFIHCRHGKHRSVLASALYEIQAARIKTVDEFNAFLKKHKYYDIPKRNIFGIKKSFTIDEIRDKRKHLTEQKDNFLKLFPLKTK